MDRIALQKRYQYLWTGEAVSATLFVAILLWSIWHDGVWQHWIVRTYSLGVVILILIQGVTWWRWKLRTLANNQRHIPPSVLVAFRRWRRINWWLIGAFPLVVVAAHRLTGQPLFSTDFGVGLLIWVGAILEQINYYSTQLMYDNAYDWAYLRTHRHLRRGTIAKEFDAQEAKAE